MATPCRVLLVDDDPHIREAFSALIGLKPDFEVCGSVDGALAAMQGLEEFAPDLVVTDLDMPGPDGIQLTKAIRALLPSVHVMVLSSHDESLFAERALLAGASGYLMKVDAAIQLFEAMATVHRGGIHLSDSMWRQLYRTPLSEPLTAEETQLLSAFGLGNPPIHTLAERLGAAVLDIERTSISLIRKLGFVGHAQLRLHAARERTRIDSEQTAAPS